MTRKILIASLLGTLAMFLWTFVAHMALPLGEAGIKQIDNEETLLASMQSVLPGHGIYLFPNMPPGMTQEQYMEKTAKGPSGLLIYFPQRNFNFAQALGVEFFTEFAQMLVAMGLLSLTRLNTFGARMLFFAAAGVMVTIHTNVSYWNWYGFPTTYTLGYIFTGFTAYLCAGLVAAWRKIGG